jgi:hypothetical protein
MRALPAEEADARALPQPRFRSWFGRLPAQPEQAKRGLREEDLGALQARPRAVPRPRRASGRASHQGRRASYEATASAAARRLGRPVARGRRARRWDIKALVWLAAARPRGAGAARRLTWRGARRVDAGRAAARDRRRVPLPQQPRVTRRYPNNRE